MSRIDCAMRLKTLAKVRAHFQLEVSVHDNSQKVAIKLLAALRKCKLKMQTRAKPTEVNLTQLLETRPGRNKVSHTNG